MESYYKCSYLIYCNFVKIPVGGGGRKDEREREGRRKIDSFSGPSFGTNENVTSRDDTI